MPRYRLTIEYHGGPFVGWQRQAQGTSVQGAIEAALAALEPGEHRVQGAGRTDAGVHATGQVAHCDLGRNWDPFRLAEALNHHLRPAPVAVLAAARVDQDFHARFSAIHRNYTYRIVNRRAPLTLDAGRAWRVSNPLDAGAMQAAADLVIGRHDFTTFRSVQCQSASPVKTLDDFRVERRGDEILCHLGARSFLHNQVRSLVGTIERVGAGRWPVERMAEALAARDRSACGPVAPPDGLVLTGVRYPGDANG
ncbi:tRNA pseudouridine(38-40) synthase TruA [Limibaculum sp. M0105]|uniref:tRNA pseudouridine synthase A n=1 Tax=Thermohalobaculum xanthum TaxID=2753746 RepID=A0A8J7M9C3_9RHOB|nr:tRNA pseudouridine(38-40) synthase TruA [Thermohalobaculum xanthum]MBK0401104.1 tRNA pseudouridine(38-40) synthase TruA [Thermohalobaculum xanthum]